VCAFCGAPTRAGIYVRAPRGVCPFASEEER
jgi:hypothetical protein